MSSLTSHSRYLLATISARMVARRSPSQAAMASSTSASSWSSSGTLGFGLDDIETDSADRGGRFVPLLFFQVNREHEHMIAGRAPPPPTAPRWNTLPPKLLWGTSRARMD